MTRRPTSPIPDRLTPEWVARTWDHSAPGYDRRWVHGLQTEAEHRVWSGLFRRLLGDQPLRVLDVGCGTGVATLLLAGLGHDVVGIDLSAGMLAKARENAARAGLDVALEQGPAEATPFADGQFDAVVSRQVLWSLAEPERAVREWIRVVRLGGQVIAVDGFWHDPRPLARASVRAGDALARLSGVRPGRYEHPYWDDAVDQMPLSRVRSVDPARNAFVRSGLFPVLAQELDDVDAVERAGMPLYERLRNLHRRYLVEGWVPDSG